MCVESNETKTGSLLFDVKDQNESCFQLPRNYVKLCQRYFHKNTDYRISFGANN